MIGLIIIVELYAAQYGEEQHNQIEVHMYKMQRLRGTMKYVMLIRIIMTMMLFSWPGAAAYSRSMARWRFCKSKASNGAGLRLIVMIIIINFLIMIIIFNIPILSIIFKFASLRPPMALIFIENFWSWPGHVQLSHCDHDVQLSHPDYHIEVCKSRASNGADLRLIILNFLVLITIINFLTMIIMFNTSC